MTLKIIICLALLITTWMLTFSCSQGGNIDHEKVKFNSLKDVPDSAWEKLSKKEIYFGHQSVGFNIMDGVQDLMKEYPQIKLNIIETHDNKDFKSGIFAHSKVGANQDPQSKIDEFSKVIEHGIGSKAQAAMLKFCYVDIVGQTDVTQVFKAYRDEVEKIKKNHPNLTIIHFTVPLKQRQEGWKAFIKKIIGRKIIGTTDNIKRTEYNELLQNTYGGKEPIIDIAKIESTYPDGSRCSFEKDGKKYYSLVPEYTYDGGHLNQLGRKRVAEQFLHTLVNTG